MWNARSVSLPMCSCGVPSRVTIQAEPRREDRKMEFRPLAGGCESLAAGSGELLGRLMPLLSQGLLNLSEKKRQFFSPICICAPIVCTCSISEVVIEYDRFDSQNAYAELFINNDFPRYP